jgi:hypothetical protein
MTDKNVALPQNVEEFNAIAGFALAQLYKAACSAARPKSERESC